MGLGMTLHRDSSALIPAEHTLTILDVLLMPAGKETRWFRCICKASNCVSGWARSLAAMEMKAFISL